MPVRKECGAIDDETQSTLKLVVVAVQVIRPQLVDGDEDDEGAVLVRRRRLRREWSGEQEANGGKEESKRMHGKG